MRKQVQIEQRSDLWHAWRKGKIGCSDVPVIMEESPWKSPLMLWQEKMEGISRPPSASMQRGIDYEDEARQEACIKLGVSWSPACFEHSRIPYMIASVDGWCDGVGALEIKVPTKEEYHLAAMSKIVPAHYHSQLQAIMMVTDTKDIWYVSYWPETKKVNPILVKKDDEHCERIEGAIKDFYERMQNAQPPEEKIDRPFFEDVDELAPKILYAQEQYSKWKKEYEDLRDLAISKTGSQNAMLGNLKITKVVRPGNVNYSQIPQLKNVDLESFRKEPIVSYRFS